MLTAEAVHAIITDCLFTDEEARPLMALPREEIEKHARMVEGVTRTFGFHPERLERHRAEIAALLAELPDQFHDGKGGGWSMLNAFVDRGGNHWGEHRDIEALIALGIATGLAHYMVPRTLWPSLPGGLPYFAVSARPS